VKGGGVDFCAKSTVREDKPVSRVSFGSGRCNFGAFISEKNANLFNFVVAQIKNEVKKGIACRKPNHTTTTTTTNCVGGST
jgi:hypothetical protein